MENAKFNFGKKNNNYQNLSFVKSYILNTCYDTLHGNLLCNWKDSKGLNYGIP